MIGGDSRANEIFLSALKIASADGRNAYLDDACRDDVALRQYLEALLQAHEHSQHLLESPVPRDQEETADVSSEQPSPMVGGRYKLLEPIGEGGCGCGVRGRADASRCGVAWR